MTAADGLRRASGIAGDMLGAMGVALGVPIAILAIGTPIVLCVRLLLWSVGML